MMASTADDLRLASSPDRIRVLHFVSTFALKTDTKWLAQLLAHLPHERVQSAIACFYGEGEMRARFDAIGLETFTLSAERELSPTALRRAWRLIRSWRPDIVHTHLLRADLYAGLAARIAGVPVILSTSYAIGQFRRARVRRVDPLLDWVCGRLPTDMLAVSGAVAEDLKSRRHWPADRVHVVRTGVSFPAELDRAAAADSRGRIRASWRIPNDAVLVLTSARLNYEKGINVLARAAERVMRICPSARFVVAGDGPMREELQAQIDAAGLTDVFTLAGFRTDMEAVLASADVFVLPSLMDGMPNALLEAYAAGLPVIATSVGGCPEAVDDNRTGLLVPPGDPDALAAAIARLAGDAPLREKLAAEGHRWARERFAVEVVTRQYAALYDRLLERNAPRRRPASCAASAQLHGPARGEASA